MQIYEMVFCSKDPIKQRGKELRFCTFVGRGKFDSHVVSKQTGTKIHRPDVHKKYPLSKRQMTIAAALLTRLALLTYGGEP